MVVCPSGHDSATTDYCDVCGIALDEVSSPVAPKIPAAPPAQPCPSCGAPRTGRFCEACGHDFTSATPTTPAAGRPGAPDPSRRAPAHPGQPTAVQPGPAQPGPAQPAAAHLGAGQPEPAAGRWVAVAAADPEYYRRVVAEGGPDAESIALPAYVPERRFTLTVRQVHIGRRSVSRGIDPEIDLSGPPEDPGVSHLHAVLLAQPDGGWAILDPGSTNGTTVNDDPDPIRPNVAVVLSDGDRIHVGAWTTITVRAHSSG